MSYTSVPHIYINQWGGMSYVQPISTPNMNYIKEYTSYVQPIHLGIFTCNQSYEGLCIWHTPWHIDMSDNCISTPEHDVSSKVTKWQIYQHTCWSKVNEWKYLHYIWHQKEWGDNPSVPQTQECSDILTPINKSNEWQLIKTPICNGHFLGKDILELFTFIYENSIKM